MTARLYAFAAITALAGLSLLWLALQLPGSAEVTTLVGPRTWPLVILILMLALLALMVALLALRGPDQFVGSDETPPEAAAAVTPEDAAVAHDKAPATGLRYLGVLAATIAYTVAMSFTGYLPATAAFAAVVTVILGERRPLRVALTTLIAVLLVAVLFDRLLSIPLP